MSKGGNSSDSKKGNCFTAIARIFFALKNNTIITGKKKKKLDEGVVEASIFNWS
jgi:hypothetical protein